MNRLTELILCEEHGGRFIWKENTGKWETEKNYVDMDKQAKDAEY